MLVFPVQQPVENVFADEDAGRPLLQKASQHECSAQDVKFILLILARRAEHVDVSPQATQEIRHLGFRYILRLFLEFLKGV